MNNNYQIFFTLNKFVFKKYNNHGEITYLQHIPEGFQYSILDGADKKAFALKKLLMLKWAQTKKLRWHFYISTWSTVNRIYVVLEKHPNPEYFILCMNQVIEAEGQEGFWDQGVNEYDVSVTVCIICDRKY